MCSHTKTNTKTLKIEDKNRGEKYQTRTLTIEDKNRGENIKQRH